MLTLLHIENIAIIEAAEIEFDAGLNVLTGETGAGKSIVVDAIGAIIGERTSRDIIRTGAKSALVSAVFSHLPMLPWFAANGMGPDEDGVLLLQREIQSDGKNICRLNGRLLTVSQLKALGQQLLNIHGQHDGQQLLDERYHIYYLDRFAGNERLLTQFEAAYDALHEAHRALKSLKMDAAEQARRVDNLRFQIVELERAKLVLGEDETLTERRNILRNAGKLIDAVEAAHIALSGDDEQAGAVALVMLARQSLAGAGQVSDVASEAAEKAGALHYDLADLAELVRDLRTSFDFEPDELDRLEERLDVIYRLKKKYGATVAEVLDYLEHCRKELDEIECADETLLKLEKKQAEAFALAHKQGEALATARRAGAGKLEARILRELDELDMRKVQFKVEFAAKTTENGMDRSGMDEIQFLMSANVGEGLKPIQKIASGGELSRIMLALKNVLAENDDVSTLVFDEVDTGVSGRAAQRVAEKIAAVATHKQVLCVTHLPQIAAMADTHFAVEKGESKGRTFTAVDKLDLACRKAAVARLSGGETLSPAMLEGAGELLSAAEGYKRDKKWIQ